MKPVLKFNIRNQKISRVDNFLPVRYSKNYLYAEFDFKTEDWTLVAKTAIFTSQNHTIHVVLGATDTCLVPPEVLTDTWFTVSVFGGDLITVTTEKIKLYESGYRPDGVPEPTPDVYTQLLNMVSNKADGLRYSENILSLLSGDKTIATVTITSASDEGDSTAREIELRNNGTYIQWKYTDETLWRDLVSLEDISGKDAYKYAQEAGYTKSEEQFAIDLAKEPGATEEQAKQIEKNKKDISSLSEAIENQQKEIDEIKENGTGLIFDYLTEEIETNPCTGLILNPTTLSFNGSGQQTITATPTPTDTTDSIAWTSSDKNVATVSNGVVTAIGNGSCTITATCGDIKATCSVNVSGISTVIPVTGVSLDKTTASVNVGEEITLTATIEPLNASNQNLTWTSDNETVAKVVNGVVTGISDGTATIGVMTEEGGFSATCNVTVEEVVSTTYRNLFDKNTMVTAEQGITGDGTIGTYKWGLARVPVKENTVYSLKNCETGITSESNYYGGATNGAIGFANADGELISRLSLGTDSQVESGANGINANYKDYIHGEMVGNINLEWITFKTPTGCTILMFNTNLRALADAIQLEEGDTIHDYYLPYEGSE